jgi:polyhydroxybutyrate depolymerase
VSMRFSQYVREFFCGAVRGGLPSAPVVEAGMPRPEGMRRYLKAAPARQAGEGRRPLVVVLHGSGASAAQVLGQAFPPSPLSVWLEIAEREKIVVVAPDGARLRGKRAWNDGFAGIASNPDVDDVGFVSAVIARCIAEDGADPQRVYVVGVSKGGMMAYRLAVELAPQVAAFCAILAGMPIDRAYPAPTLPVSAMIAAGTADPFMPYRGGKSWRTLWFMAPMLGIEHTAALWRGLAGLPEQPAAIRHFPQRDGAATRATCTVWGDDPAAVQVALLKVEGGGHAEPSGRRRYPGLFSRFPGRQNDDLEIAEEAWAFFKDKRAARRGQQAAGAAVPLNP